jgi:anthranilate phosphoribosyltransferase
VLALNAGAALYAADRVDSIARGVDLAREIIAAGSTLETIEKMRRASHGEL